MVGRYVIIQMDNGEGVPLNLKEVRAYGLQGARLGVDARCLFFIKNTKESSNSKAFVFEAVARADNFENGVISLIKNLRTRNKHLILTVTKE